MFDELLTVAASYGIWAAMFLGLLVYLLQDSRRREIKYQQVVEKLTTHLEVVNDIKEDVKELKAELKHGTRRKYEGKIKKEKFLDKPMCGDNVIVATAGSES